MKYLFIVIDGMGDLPDLPAAKELMGLIGGKVGTLTACPDGMRPESCGCILSLFHIPEAYGFGRAYFEGLANGIHAKQDEMIMRCNLVEVNRDGVLTSFQGGRLSGGQIRGAMGKLSHPPLWKLAHLSGYRGLLTAKGSASLDIPPPHEHEGEQVSLLLKKAYREIPLLWQMERESRPVLDLLGNGEVSYHLYPWGISQGKEISSFADRYGMQAGAVCAAEIARGISIALGMDTPVILGATGEVDTDLSAKREAAWKLLREYPFVWIHINGADEAAHRRDREEKNEFIRRIGRELIKPLISRIEMEDTSLRMMICADHGTDSETGRHAAIPCPYGLSQWVTGKKVAIIDGGSDSRPAIIQLIDEEAIEKG